MAGRDVRRLAARASTVTHENKMDAVARAATGADAMGIDEIVVVREPFRIAERALEWLPLNASVQLVETPLEHSERDTEYALTEFVAKEVDHVVSLGGDGTHRIIARTVPDICLVPISTGTNNVYPQTVEPTIAGMVGALGARGLLPQEICGRHSKIAHLSLSEQTEDIGVIDIVCMENDLVGNLRPFDPQKLRELVLTRAEPASIGMSPIGGLVDPISEEEDAGLYVKLGSGKPRRIAVSPGHFRDVRIEQTRRVDLGEPVFLKGPGLIAIDGDRLYQMTTQDRAEITLRRDGPFVYDVQKAMTYAAQQGLCP